MLQFEHDTMIAVLLHNLTQLDRLAINLEQVHAETHQNGLESLTGTIAVCLGDSWSNS